MIETKQPKVFLFNHTSAPLKNIGLAVSAWASEDFFESLDDMDIAQAHRLADKGLKAFHKVSLEYVQLTFVIKNVSRAFQQQLTRTRMASYSIQSMRVVTKKGFASNGHYTMPPNLTEKQQEEFHNAMLDIEYRYHNLLDAGVSAENARGILPLNTHSDISMNISLAALYHMLRQRFCVLTQWEYRQVALQMRNLVKTRLGETLAEPMEAPCVAQRKCPMREEYCGVPVWRLDFEQRTNAYKHWPNNPETYKVKK